MNDANAIANGAVMTDSAEVDCEAVVDAAAVDGVAELADSPTMDSEGVDTPGAVAPGETGAGGAIGTGGSGTGGALGSGGAVSAGGTGTGGAVGTGGVVSTGGTGTGGAVGTGGVGTGGVVGSGGAGTGGTVATGGTGTGGVLGTGGAGTGGTGAGDTAKYNFEQSIQSWLVPDTTPPFTSLVRSTAKRFAGAASLAGTVAVTVPDKYYMIARPPTPAVPAGATVTYHVFVPQGSAIDWVQPYVREGLPDYRWTGTIVDIANLSVGAWSTITVVVPADAVPIEALGVQFHVNAPWTGTIYIDSINW